MGQNGVGFFVCCGHSVEYRTTRNPLMRRQITISRANRNVSAFEPRVRTSLAVSRMCCTKKRKPFIAKLWLCVLVLAPSSSSGGTRTDEISIASEEQSWRSPDDDNQNVPFWFASSQNAAASLLHKTETAWTNRPCCEGAEGAEAEQFGRFPYICSLRLSGSRKHVCTATLIDQRWILAAAHCIDPNRRQSAGCYPLVYCGDSRVNTPSAEQVIPTDLARNDVEIPIVCRLCRPSMSSTPTYMKIGSGTSSTVPTLPC